ncbi:MAG TPA: pyridoxamine 5'-phosphate oxidase family protein [Dehalococcoidia bacterium]|nr:pyridoxamine 5'-phosphate oxidase family protein [Dehalococcoidia bacterium]
MPDISPEASQWLKDHSLCIFATGRKDGSPQQSYIGYQFDGSQFLLGGQATSFKMKNLARQPRCSLSIVDGRGYVVAYGKAELVSDPAEMEKLQARFGPRGAPPRPAGAPPAAGPPARPMGARVNILFRPDKIIANRMTG